MADYVQVLTTADSADAAGELARSVVQARLAACAQVVGPIRSHFRWEGAVQIEDEWQVLYKTTAERYLALEAHLAEIHTYDEPEIIATPIVAGSAGYLGWVAQETAS